MSRFWASPSDASASEAPPQLNSVPLAAVSMIPSASQRTVQAIHDLEVDLQAAEMELASCQTMLSRLETRAALCGRATGPKSEKRPSDTSVDDLYQLENDIKRARQEIDAANEKTAMLLQKVEEIRKKNQKDQDLLVESITARLEVYTAQLELVNLGINRHEALLREARGYASKTSDEQKKIKERDQQLLEESQLMGLLKPVSIADPAPRPPPTVPHARPANSAPANPRVQSASYVPTVPKTPTVRPTSVPNKPPNTSALFNGNTPWLQQVRPASSDREPPRPPPTSVIDAPRPPPTSVIDAPRPVKPVEQPKSVISNSSFLPLGSRPTVAPNVFYASRYRVL